MKAENFVGRKIGRLTVLSRAENQITPNGSIRAMWNCRCDCGQELVVSSQGLRKNKLPSCGCWKNEKTSESHLHDIKGKRYGRLLVIERAESASQTTTWLCQCDCGKRKIVSANNLKSGHTTSCGCYSKELTRSRSLTHGMTNKRIYRIWKEMKDRCNNPNSLSYKNYGGRGITVCDEWNNNPMAFVRWSYANGYKSDLSIDRIDVNGNYEPSNCRWADTLTQARNRRNTVYVEYRGVEKPLAEWCELLNLPYEKTRKRIRIENWDVEKAFGLC